MVHLVPYRKMPMLIIEYIVGQAKSTLNDLPPKTGISTTMSERNITEGRPNLDYNTMSLNTGSYIQLFEGKKNIQQIRSLGAVSLNPSNEKWVYYFMGVITVCKLHGFIWTELPITEEVITRIKELGKEDKKLLMENGQIFEWIPGNIILDKKDDKEVFDNLINDLQHHQNDDDNRNYVPDNSDGDDC